MNETEFLILLLKLRQRIEHLERQLRLGGHFA